MKNAVRTLMFALIAIGVLALLTPTTAKAVGTASNTLITNKATINYEVGGVPQELIESKPGGNQLAGFGNGLPTTFRVDNIVDLAVATTDGTYVPVQSGGTDYVLTFTVANEGNTAQDYALTVKAGNDPFNVFAADDFDATNLRVFVEDGISAGYQATGDAATFIDELAADTTATVYILGDMPALLANGDISGIVLTAITYDGGGVGIGALTVDAGAADQAQTVDVVFGDGAGAHASEGDAALNGMHAATSAYQVGAALLTVTKTETIQWDPIRNAVNPLHIPGAIAEYTVTIANGVGGATATNITLTDTLDANLTFVTDTYNGGGCLLDPCGIEVTAPNINGGVAQELTGATDADEGEEAAGVITVDGIDLLATESATITYRVTVN